MPMKTLRSSPHSTHIKWPPMRLSFLACKVGTSEQARLHVNASNDMQSSALGPWDRLTMNSALVSSPMAGGHIIIFALT